MADKRILVVDDEEPFLDFIKRILEVTVSDCQVVTAGNGFVALDELRARRFDLVITDYNMYRMDGLEFLETVSFLQPNARVIMITGYQNDWLELETSRHQIFHYLNKPFLVADFRSIVQDALSSVESQQPTLPVLPDELFVQVDDQLKQLKQNVSARLIFLADLNGHILNHIGDVRQVRKEELVSLLGGGMATLAESSRILDSDEAAISLAYRESTKQLLYAVNVGDHLLILIIDRSQSKGLIGSVWYYARQTALQLRDLLDQIEHMAPMPILGSEVAAHIATDLDQMLGL